MSEEIELDRLLHACSDDSEVAGLHISAELEPLAGPGAPVKPAVYEGGQYQHDRRWESPNADAPAEVVVIDNVPSQANRLEAALQGHRERCGLPELVLDLTGVAELPAHLPRRLSSWQFPHRNADAYLRDADIDGEHLIRTDLGSALFAATPWDAGALVAWFPQALLYGFWQSHLGKKRANTKHARAWVSEIIGWRPASTTTRVMGLKGDALNLSTDEQVTSNPDDRVGWEIGKAKIDGGKTDKLSKMGHGQVPFMEEGDAAPAGISFARVTQSANLSTAQLRRVSLGERSSAEADAAARALVTSLGILAHVSAFGRGFALRSGADLVPTSTNATWVQAGERRAVKLPSVVEAVELVGAAQTHAGELGVPLDGWGREPVVLTPRDNLAKAIRATWPLDDSV